MFKSWRALFKTRLGRRHTGDKCPRAWLCEGSAKAMQWVKTAAFIIVFAAVLWCVTQVMMLKHRAGILPMQCLYAQEENTIDLLVIGPSLSGMGLDMECFWHDYGIAGYDIWSSGQQLSTSYYCLREALKRQRPKVVMLEVSAIGYNFHYIETSAMPITLSGMRFGMNYIMTTLNIAPPSLWWDVFFSITSFHTRFEKLYKHDFMYFPWCRDLINDKGSGPRFGNEQCLNMSDVSCITEVKRITRRQEERYLHKFIDLCQRENIALILFKAPSRTGDGIYSRVYYKPYCNYVSLLAKQCSVPFIDTNLLDKEIGFALEDTLEGNHLNAKGARKMTKYFGDILQREYNLSDHRGEKRYASWDAGARSVRQDYLMQLKGTKDYGAELLRALDAGDKVYR